MSVEESATAVANEIAGQIKVALEQGGDMRQWSFELLEASRGLDAEAAALNDPAVVQARIEQLRAHLAQLTDPAALAEQRQVMSRAAARLRQVAAREG